MTTSSNGNIFHFIGPLWGEPPVARGFPSQTPVTRSVEFCWFCARTNGWANNRDAGELRHHRVCYGFTVMPSKYLSHLLCWPTCVISKDTEWCGLFVMHVHWNEKLVTMSILLSLAALEFIIKAHSAIEYVFRTKTLTLRQSHVSTFLDDVVNMTHFPNYCLLVKAIPQAVTGEFPTQ